MAKRKSSRQSELNTEILIGFVNSFKFNDPSAEEALAGHPKEGRLYQIIKDTQYGYRLHIGAENTPSAMAGILLGQDLVGNHDDKWQFDVAIVTKDNFLNFTIHEEDTIKLGEWFETNNKELKETIEQPVKVVASDSDGNFVEMEDPTTLMNDVMAKFDVDQEMRYSDFSDHLNTILAKDRETFDILVDLVAYLNSCYSDKYEQSSRQNFSKEFLLSTKSPDTNLYNALKYIQRYCTTGFEKSANKKDLFKAIHYTLFELQRTKRNEQ